MIRKEDFTKIITDYQGWRNRMLRVSEVLGIDFLDPDWIEYTHFLFQDLIKSHFDEGGVDWINWWLFEKPTFAEGKGEAWDADGKVIPTETVEDLWNIVENHRLNDFEFLDKKE